MGVVEVSGKADEYRPAPEPDFMPTPEEEQEAVDFLNGDDFDVRTDDEWETLAEAAYADDMVCSGIPWL